MRLLQNEKKNERGVKRNITFILHIDVIFNLFLLKIEDWSLISIKEKTKVNVGINMSKSVSINI